MSNEYNVCQNCGIEYYWDTEASSKYCALVCSHGCAENMDLIKTENKGDL